MKIVGHVDICGFDYSICLASSKEVSELQNADGWCDWENCRIYLRNNLSKKRLKDTLMHEILHAIFESSGISGQLLLLKNKDFDAAEELEELIIRMLTPNMLLVMRQLKGILP